MRHWLRVAAFALRVVGVATASALVCTSVVLFGIAPLVLSVHVSDQRALLLGSTFAFVLVSPLCLTVSSTRRTSSPWGTALRGALAALPGMVLEMWLLGGGMGHGPLHVSWLIYLSGIPLAGAVFSVVMGKAEGLKG